MSRRAAIVLLATFGWTTYVWVTRLVILAGSDDSAGFKAVHAVLAVVSLAFGVAVGWIGLRALLAAKDRGEPEPLREPSPRR